MCEVDIENRKNATCSQVILGSSVDYKLASSLSEMICYILEYTFYLSGSIVGVCRSRKKCALLDTENRKNATYSQILGSRVKNLLAVL